MIFITGDCHGDYGKFKVKKFPIQKELTKDDFVIVCGDFGLWNDDGEEKYWFDWLEKKNFTLLFVDGNHENFDRLLKDFEKVDFHGGTAHKIRSNIYHLIRGNIFTFEGKTFFTFGGARSHDISDGVLDIDDFENERDFKRAHKKLIAQGKMFRINHKSWWKEEMPNKDEMNFALSNLKNHNNKIDYIITHCCPEKIEKKYDFNLFGNDDLTTFFNKIYDENEFSHWYFGHYHDNRKLDNLLTMLYENVEKLI